MTELRPLFFATAFLVSAPAAAETQTLCTLVADAATGKVIHSEGPACDRRTTPASTFKIALSLMGYDSGFLKDAHNPALPFREGYVDWVPAWRQTTDPARWLEKSVVWYSQRITRALGAERFAAYTRAFDYGNADVSGDPGKENGLDRAWLTSSLKISPREQVTFLRRLVKRDLPVSARAFEMTEVIADYGVRAGWHVYGKTGAARSRDADGNIRRGKPYGWFVGWAEKGGRAIVFARLIQEDRRRPGSPGSRARDALFGELFSGKDPL